MVKEEQEGVGCVAALSKPQARHRSGPSFHQWAKCGDKSKTG